LSADSARAIFEGISLYILNIKNSQIKHTINKISTFLENNIKAPGFNLNQKDKDNRFVIQFYYNLLNFY